ncbi:four helix bundle protein [Robertkochia flava]|uniref:four helix bundle protein n=1 Tax=Robertkochia flava TaxID=3447986 RepID=UPI001CCDB8B8|nr:four helix bundle protein [Robertkochia marina]
MNLIKEKSYAFALEIVKYYKYLTNDKKEYVMSKQLLKSGTAIGANYREAEHAESKADFIHKLSIAQKESNETMYWIDLLNKSGYLNDEDSEILRKEIKSIAKIITRIILTTKAKS